MNTNFSTRLFLILSLFCTILILANPIFVLAQGTDCPPSTICIDNPLKQNTIEGIIKAFTDLLRTIAIPVGILMIVWGGIQIMTGMTTGEKEKKVVQGKKTITWAIIGTAIVILVDFIVGIVIEILGK